MAKQARNGSVAHPSTPRATERDVRNRRLYRRMDTSRRQPRFRPPPRLHGVRGKLAAAIRSGVPVRLSPLPHPDPRLSLLRHGAASTLRPGGYIEQLEYTLKVQTADPNNHDADDLYRSLTDNITECGRRMKRDFDITHHIAGWMQQAGRFESVMESAVAQSHAVQASWISWTRLCYGR